MNTITKEEQRKVVKRNLANMSEHSIAIKSNLIVSDIIKSGFLNDYNDILLYKALPNEVNVDLLIDYLLDLGKNVYLPRVNGVNLDIVKLPCEFAYGAYNIIEPIGQAYSGDIDAVIVPVLAVDKNYNRLGKGKGYYDRFLADKKCFKIALAFEEQVVDNVIVDTNDIKMDMVVVR